VTMGRRHKCKSIQDALEISTRCKRPNRDSFRLCQFLLRRCLERGVKLHHPAVALSVSTDVRDEMASVCIGHSLDLTETDVPCTKLVIAAGSWSPQVFLTLFPGSAFRLPISSLAGHSLVVRPKERSAWSTKGVCHAIFSTDGPGFSPELFSRADGTIYIAGLNSSLITLPKLPTDTMISPQTIKALKEATRKIVGSAGTGVLDEDLEIVREGLCFRPISASGRPILSRMPDGHLGQGITTRGGAEGGVFVATGHGPWGISHSLGTGKVMAEMIQGRELSIDVSSLVIS
jgi:glycine/D-amino acid oxidase-like deaminating enzyme